MKDRSGIFLVLAGTFLILGNVWGQEDTGNGKLSDAGQNLEDSVLPGAGSGQERDNLSDNSSTMAGDIRIAGSSSMERYVSALAEGFMEKYPDVEVSVQFTGSSAGIAAVTGGSAEIGISSRYLGEEERAAGAVETIVGLDGIAICVNPANGVHALSREELGAIYTGEIVSWPQLGGNDLPIVVTGREAGSGTRSAFEDFLGLEGRCTYANELDSTGAVGARIRATPGAIGYLSLEAAERMRNDMTSGNGLKGGAGNAERQEGSQEAQIRILSLDGTEPSMANIEEGIYPLYRPFAMVTKGEIKDQSRVVCAWFGYVFSEEGRGIAERMKIAEAQDSSK